jgi:hypothetical protein
MRMRLAVLPVAVPYQFQQLVNFPIANGGYWSL